MTDGNPAPLVDRCRALAAAMDLFDETACRTLGVNRTDLRALNLLEHGPLTAGDIAARLGLTSGSVTLLIDRLARAGHVVREHPPDDRRRVLVSLTPRTFRAFAEVYAPLGARVGAAADAWDDAVRDAADVALGALAEVFTDQAHRLAEGAHGSP